MNPVRREVVLAAGVVVLQGHGLPAGFEFSGQRAPLRPPLLPERGVQNVTVETLGAVLLLILLDRLSLDSVENIP